ncbi:MAG: hypothetical protein RI904_1548 [Pseudomonadota bacterium]
MSVLIHLCLTFGMLSLLAVGGGTAVIPEMQTVLKWGWYRSYSRNADSVEIEFQY